MSISVSAVISPSKVPAFALTIMGILVAASLFLLSGWSDLALPARLVLSFLIIAFIIFAAWTGRRKDSVRLIISGQGQIVLNYLDPVNGSPQKSLAVQLSKRSIVRDGLMFLYFTSADGSSLPPIVIFQDSIDRLTMHRLRVSLLWIISRMQNEMEGESGNF
ncbi:protein YgfX [Undibacterium oligocarboniphilum]|uniref:Flagellar hook-length control protein n=1 Tax=Undibacterium oligocarboniphilum TaxID=666702 RepID=A0A850QFJ1_9BURK|nr:protein YgfX [Undibacterium oligocarboniphilum]MBC3870340.1 hypothetical protein [Undibacterium oligocarboniphilum]NVO78331.1 hypothetical protein [Undibacterium oligocarboniphilum]